MPDCPDWSLLEDWLDCEAAEPAAAPELSGVLLEDGVEVLFDCAFGSAVELEPAGCE